ncbi:MAG: sulfotransferase, partial [Verrucomicrobia bacterium]|nr:sulfotransferase [Verrucomicrobiota bacterium]
PRLLGFALDSPPAGFRADEYSIDISGWLVGKSARAMGVKVTCGSEIVRQTDVWLPRPDIEDLVSRKLQKETFLRRFVRSLGRRRGNKLIEEAAASGFHASVNLLGLPEKFKLRVRGLLADGTRVELGEIKGRHLPVRTSCLNKFQPLILSGLGRSGSSWLIHLIGEHPGIITHLSHPYISRVAVHAMRVFQVQSTPSNPVRTKEMRGTTWETQSVSSLPLLCRTIDPAGESWLRKNRVELLAAQTQEMIEEFYAQVAMRQKKSQARFFAEKVFLYPFIGQLFANLYPSGREIFLVRDFRDVACSRQKFHARRPGREKLSHEHHVKNTAVRAKLLLEHWKARRSRAHLVRYEDLVLRPAETLGSLFEYLELENAPAMIASIIERAAQNTPGLDRHRTIDDATRTIGRWRHDLTPDLQRLCETQCSDALREFGYLEGC